ncbi:MAG: suppressor of fused domain protein [Bacilli bacterium]|nr:suppressor of fused domain protein [Bacilli bacterium]
MSIVKQAKFYMKGKNVIPKYFYTEEEAIRYENYIRFHIGDFEKVYHELYSPDIHLDILVIPPTKECNYYKLVTEGMGAYKMNVPDLIKNEEMDRAELIIYLPPTVNLKDITKKYGWVISQLKILSRIPIEEKSWIGFGHTFAHDVRADTNFSDKTNFSASILIEALDKIQDEMVYYLKEKERINFYQVIPLYKEEYLFQKTNGTDALLQKFIDNKMSLVVDENRKNLCLELDKEISEDNIEEEMDI